MRGKLLTRLPDASIASPEAERLKLRSNLVEATFISRPNRFVARMRKGGRVVLAHVANSGRLQELLDPRNKMLLAPVADRGRRKTRYDLALVEVDGVLVSADARLPNALVREAIEAGCLPELGGFDRIAQEVTFEDSRLDLVLSGRAGACYVEVKSVTLVRDGVALFPDAPTVRGRKHLLSLGRAVRQGHRAAVVFVIQRSDASSFSPNETADPEFYRALRDAAKGGVEAYAYRCAVDRTSVEISDAVPVRLT